MLLLCMNELLGLQPRAYDVRCSLPPSTCISRANFLVFRVMRLLLEVLVFLSLVGHRQALLGLQISPPNKHFSQCATT